MSCDDIRPLLDARLDRELDPASDLKVTEHLRGCGECREADAHLTTLREGLQEILPRYSLPAGLEDRVLASVRREAAETFASPAAAPSRPASLLPTWRFSPQGAALAAGLFLLGGITGGIIGRQKGSAPALSGRTLSGSETALADELVSSHVRSLMAAHLYDVVSTNQHTVKPWFAGKLDFSPPVVNPADQGFPLAGGRLDYIDSRPVAAMVYRRHQHWINLFVWPTTSNNFPLAQQAERGYNVYRWTRDGMQWAAVSDVSPEDLQAFVALIQAGKAAAPETSPASPPGSGR